MIRFLLKGLLRDRTRSLFPFLIVTAGVMLIVFLHAWLNGARSSMVDSAARFRTGHASVTTRAYAVDPDRAPNEYALLGVDTLLATLRTRYPDLAWTPRITFGGLLDIPDERGETREQLPVSGFGVDLLSTDSPEWSILNIRPALVAGRAIRNHKEILITDELAHRLRVQPGQQATVISSTMDGSMAVANFTIAGTVRFGIAAMDRGTVLADLSDIQNTLDMENGASRIIGFFRDDLLHEQTAEKITGDFNASAGRIPGRFAPVMGTLRTQSGLSDILEYVKLFSNIIVAIFGFAMSVVLWNAGLTGSLRRYGEFGLRLAVGEEKGHVYRSMITESLAIGVAGSAAGTGLGLACAYTLQVHGFDISSMMQDSTMMLTDVIRAQIEPATFVIGLGPGILATFLGSAVSGIGIYRRQTSQLFKELET